MIMDQGEWTLALSSLLPAGSAWSREPSSNLQKLLGGLAAEFSRIDAAVAVLQQEAEPEQSNELLDLWEIEYGLPGKCQQAATNDSQRRALLLQQMVSLPSQTKAALIDAAYKLGYVITIDEFMPGDTVPGFPGISSADAPFVLLIHMPSRAVRRFVAGSAAGDLLTDWDTPERLQCDLQRIAQAHRYLIFATHDPAFQPDAFQPSAFQ